MDEKPKINIKIEEETQIAKGSSSSPNHQNNNFDDFSNQRFQNNQSNYLNNGMTNQNSKIPSQTNNYDNLFNNDELKNNINTNANTNDLGNQSNIQNTTNNIINSKQPTNKQSSKDIKNDIQQNKNNIKPQDRNRLPKNTNPQANKQNVTANNKKTTSKMKTGVANNNLIPKKNLSITNKLSRTPSDINSDSVIDKFQKFRHPIRSLIGLMNRKKNNEDIAIDVTKKIMAASPIIFIFIISVMIIIFPMLVVTAIREDEDQPGNVERNEYFTETGTNTTENGNSIDADYDPIIDDYFKYTGTEEDKPLIEEYYKSVAEAGKEYEELNTLLLVVSTHYGLYTTLDFFDQIQNAESENPLDYTILDKNILNIANQMVYSTVVFDNNIIRREKEVEEEVLDKKTGKKVKQKVKEIVYECPASSSPIYTDIKELCKDGVATYKDGPNKIDLTSADNCENYVDDSKITEFIKDEKFNKDMKCVSFNYETNTSKSKKKLKTFFKYVLMPNRYFGKEITSDSYNWDEMISRFSNIATDEDESKYNIPLYKIGEGKEIDNYSGLSIKEQNTIDDEISVIFELSQGSKKGNKDGKYHIKGAVSLPLDFTILDPIEDTINKRISGSAGKFGMRLHPIDKIYKMHNGIDLKPISKADPIYSILDGVVVSAVTSSTGCGISVKVAHDINNDGKNDYYSVYCHMSMRFVNKGDIVSNGQQIGVMGNTGKSTGTHLHFELHDANDKPIDPVPYLIDIVKNSSNLVDESTIESGFDSDNLTEKFSNSISGNVKTRNGVVITAKFLIENVKDLPYFCGGYTTQLINPNWYKDEIVTTSSCSDYNKTAKYGLDNNGYINWVLTQSGFINKRYSNADLLKLGDSIDMYDERVKVGDLAYKNDKIGVIIDLKDATATVAYMDEPGLKTISINRKVAASIFDKVISMGKFYNEDDNDEEI